MKSDLLRKPYGYVTKGEELDTLLKLHRESWEQLCHTNNEDIKKHCEEILKETKEKMLQLL